MLRKRSSSNSQVRSSLMADCFSILSPKDKYKKPTSFPKLFTGFTTLKSLSETFDNVVMSPTSILDTKPFPGLKNPFWPDQRTPRTPETESGKKHWDKLDSKTISLGLVDALIDDKTDPTLSKPESNRMVLFGSQLKIQIPPLPTLSPAESPKSPGDFGIKTRNSPSPMKSPGLVSSNLETPNSSRVFTGCLSVSEMELSEDYTCVISHVGPNPRTTHIFDNCIVESFCFSPSRDGTKTGFFVNESSYPSESFLSSCFACKKKLDQGKDIYMYRGEKAFCSIECRHQEMLLEESLNKLDSD